LLAAALFLSVALFVFLDFAGPPRRPEIPPPGSDADGDIVYVAPGEPEAYRLPSLPPTTGLPPGAPGTPPAVEPPVGEVRPQEPAPAPPPMPMPMPEPSAPPAPAPGLRLEPTVAVVPPRLLRLDPPQYPPMARRMGREATVELRVQVGANGRVTGVEELGPPAGWGFDAAARQAARAAIYEPARRDGEPIAMASRLSIRFVLD
jgi:periplasmic protein TonB